MANRLRDEQRRLDELKIGDLAVRASFQVSYDSLQATGRAAAPARVFRILGLWEGPSISLPAAAALLGEPEDDITEALETLVDANLLESPAPDRYRFHDLLRFYATERARSEEPDEDRAAAVERLLRWYLATAEAIADTVASRPYRVPRETAGDTYPVPEFPTLDDALSWYEEERVNVVAATRQAASAGLDDVAWRLPPTLFAVFNRRNNWADCVVTHRVALESVRKCGNRLGEAWVLDRLGYSLARLGDPEAIGHLEQALAIRRELGDTLGEAQTAVALGHGYYLLQGPSEPAIEHMRHAADLLRPLDRPALRGTALNNLGEVYFALGNLDAAAECYAEASEELREAGGYALGHPLLNLGRVYLSLRRLDEALPRLAEALRLHRAAGDPMGEALALKELGRAHVATGNVTEARESLAMALAIFEKIGENDEAAEMGAALESL
jgi:tetratricopeptide (TPR) repeat protein